MTRTLIACGVLLMAGATATAEEPPESCRPKAGEALALAAEADQARMQCDIDRASQLVERSERLAPATTKPVMRIVDTASPSGAAYIYDVIGTGPSYWLSAHTVPGEESERSRVPICSLGTNLPEDISSRVTSALTTAASESIPDYGPREDVSINPDGSRRHVLLLDTHDIITTIETTQGTRHFSRHAKASDAIAGINQMIIGVANVSDGWVCNTN
ncbi:hypothetical protein [Hyphomonas johnsonii]|nr:hypothetical protein [Hyphomonas johnsonii]